MYVSTPDGEMSSMLHFSHAEHSSFVVDGKQGNCSVCTETCICADASGGHTLAQEGKKLTYLGRRRHSCRLSCNFFIS